MSTNSKVNGFQQSLSQYWTIANKEIECIFSCSNTRTRVDANCIVTNDCCKFNVVLVKYACSVGNPWKTYNIASIVLIFTTLNYNLINLV